MQDTRGMRGRQAIGHAHEEVQYPPPTRFFSRSLISQSAAIDELANRILPATPFTGVMHGQNMRMVERRNDLRLTVEAPAPVNIGQIRRNHLNRDRTIELGVAGAVHRAHAALASNAS